MQYFFWAAGFIDGEGNIQIRHLKQGDRTYHYPALRINQVDIRPLLRMKDIFGGTIHKRKPPANPKWQQAYEYTLQGDNLRMLLETILPLLTVKDGQAREALELYTRLSTPL